MIRCERVTVNDGYRPKMEGYQPQKIEKKGYQPPKPNSPKPSGTPPKKP